MCIIQSKDLSASFVLFAIYFTWAGLSCNGEVKRWFGAPQENATPPLPFAISFPIPRVNGGLPLHPQSLLHQSFTKGFDKHPFRYLHYNPVKVTSNIIFATLQMRKLKKKKQYDSYNEWQSSNRNPSLLTQVSEFLQADHTGEIKWILCQSKFVLKPSNYIPKSDDSKWTTMRVTSSVG